MNFQDYNSSNGDRIRQNQEASTARFHSENIKNL